jgi:hypothetical protein
MITVAARDLDGSPRRVECSICKSIGVQPARDPDGRWLLEWARSHPCVPSEVHHRCITRL